MSKPLPSLKAMAESHVEGVKKQTTFLIDPRKVEFEVGFNGRFQNAGLRAHIDAMKTSMRNGAVFPPLDLRVEDGRVFVVDGHCRTTAAVELMDEGEPQIMLEARHYKGSDADRAAHMITTSQGRPLTGLELGHVYLRLRRFGWSVADICKRTGRSDTHVEQMIMLAQTPMALQDMIATEKVSANTAVKAIQQYGEKRAVEILTAEVEKQLANGAKPKVTNKTLNGPSYSRATVSEMVSSLDTFYTRLSEKNRAELDTVFNNNEAELDGKMITLPAASLKVLLDAHSKVAEERMKHESRAKAKEEKAAKRNKPADGKDRA